ncbi:MAG: OmpA family protein [Candidatus Hydrogenedentes bacterium]|nr:OmpA family protein [Candidatus Hydrogenedentota bacterium]
MKKMLVMAVALALIGACGTANAAKVWDDFSWWGQSGATPDPVADSEGRSGYWWWPLEAKSNAGDSEPWGNRGVVYHSPWEAAKAEPEKPADAPPAVVAPAPRQLAIVLNNVLFDFDKSTLKPEGKVEVDKLVAELKKFPKDTVLVEGHTDSTGDEAYNMGLGQRRADSVKKYMVEMGIEDARVTTQSFGEGTPAVPNDTKANRALNRRAVFNVTIND